MRLLPAFLVLAACDPVSVEVVGDSAARGQPDSGDTADTDTAPPEDSAVYDCDALPALPIEAAEELQGFTNAEDFALDGEGYLVSIDLHSNLVGIKQDGSKKIMLAGAGMGAGTHMLADGQIVYADVGNNAIVRVDPASLSSTVLLAGLSYPNGLDVGIDGFVYVAETSAGQVRKVNAETGESTIIAKGLYAPNGVSFGPNFDSLYVGSFGGGVVYRMDLGSDGSWSRPRSFGLTPGSAGPPADVCDTNPIGTPCTPAAGYGIGECSTGDLGYATCEVAYETGACAGKVAGDACTTDAFGQPIESICVGTPYAPDLICPSAPTEWVEPCVDRTGRRCSSPEGMGGSCSQNYEGAPLCYVSDTLDAYTAPCLEKARGDACVVESWSYPIVGVCSDGAAWGAASDVCSAPPIGGGAASGLDGLNVDACGNVYASAYVDGTVWRWASEGQEPELVMNVRASWIPNMHFGNGVGGWEENVLYLANRDRGSVFAIPIGVPGHGEAFDPTP